MEAEPYKITSGIFGGSGFTLSWESIVGKWYQVHWTTALEDAWTKETELIADSEVTTYTDSTPAPESGFYQVVNIPPTPIFEEDFESAAAGWTTVTFSTTEWELGPPASEHGPGAAQSGSNVYGTDLDGDYELNTFASLYSPQIDLSGLDAATLVFSSSRDVEPALVGGELVDFIKVWAVDAQGADVVGMPLLRQAGVRAQWKVTRVQIPVEALGRSVRFEFRLTSDDFNLFDPDTGGDITQAGWFIDDVSVIPE